MIYSLLLAFSLSHSPLIDKAAEITLEIPYFEMGSQEDLLTIEEEREAIRAYQELNYGSVTVLQWEKLQENHPFKLHLIPFHDDRLSFVQLLQVFKSLFWGTTPLNQEALLKAEQEFEDHLKSSEERIEIGRAQDVFCQEAIIKKQTLWEGKTVRLLYPTSVIPAEEYAPHLMIVTKVCRPNFTSLSNEEALEVEAVSKRVFQIFKDLGFNTGIKLQKNGVVGVTVPHFHQHLIFFKETEEEQEALYKMLKNIFLGSTSLSEKQYRINFLYYQTLLKDLMVG